MDKGIARAVFALLVLSLPAYAQMSPSHPPSKDPHIAARTAGAAPSDRTGSVRRRKNAARTKEANSSAAVDLRAAIPEAEWRVIQADLAWTGDYDPTAPGDITQRTIEAIKTFQKRHGGRETGLLSDEERMLLATAVKEPEGAVGWRLIDDPATGARIGLPSKLVPQTNATRTGTRWTSALGQIQIETFRLREAALPALFEEEKKTPRRRRIEASELKPDSFVIAGEQGLKKFLVRAEASGGEVRGITILYDQATEGVMAPAAVAISNAFEGFPDPNAAPPAGSKRTVEYGTAVVVDLNGDLVASAHTTDDCQTITVPGFGHADRIAADKASDLALLRLYGARDLAPAALSGETDSSDDLTLIGIADPSVQSGGAAVTKLPAHVTAQGLETIPPRGFSGAAAIDTQGRFAGLVDLRYAAADIGPATQQATVIAAATVRGFLSAHGIAPSAVHAPIDPSVVRIVCVRK